MSKKHRLNTKPQAKVMVTDNGRQLYLLEDNGLTPNNINLSMYNITAPDAPVRAQLDRFAGNTDAALMSMSPDGCHLAVAVNKGVRGGFMGNTAAGTDLKFYIITTSGETAYILNTCNTGPYVNALSVDFAPDSRYLYFTVGSATSGYRLMRLGAVAKAAEDLIAAGGAASVARAKNGKLYLAAAGSDALTEVTHNGAAAPQIRQLQLGSAAQGFALTGVLPAQPHTALSNAASTHLFSRTVGLRAFELKDHLGNVRATISDRKLSTLDAYNKPGNFRADLLTAYNYYPFGMLQPGRNYNTNNYRYGYGGMEKDDEVSGTGSTYDFGGDIYDSRIGRRKGPDPEWKKGPGISPYSTFFNNPILYNDTKGRWPLYAHYQMTKTALIKVGYSDKVASEIAHFSAVYADNPNPNKTAFGNFIMKFNQDEGENRGIPKSELDYKQGVDYSATNNSQNDEDISAASIHATRTWWEDITPEDAVNRALNGGTYKDINGNEVVIEGALNVIEKYKGVKEADLSTSDKMAIGKALHTIQDVSAHNGARFVDEHKNEAAKKGKEYQNTHSVKRDLFGNTKHSEKATSEAADKIKQNE